jgi:hypothetical protein
MANYLLYWKDYWKDVKNYPDDINFNWHTAKESFFHRVQPNDDLWVVASAPKPQPARWALVTRIVVLRKRVVANEIRRFRIIGDPKRSQKFDFRSQSEVSAVLRKLQFETGKRILIRGRAIGKRLQAIRRLTDTDGALLRRHSQNVHPSALENSLEDAIKAGAGFGNPETNRRVERAAISHVENWYQSRGWNVTSVETERRGYDLLCKKASNELHVEVKGIQGHMHSFIITKREKEKADSDPKFVLSLVTSALTNPKMIEYSGRSVEQRFKLTALAYKAELRQYSK